MGKDVLITDKEKQYDWNDILYYMKKKDNRIAEELINDGWDSGFVHNALSRMIKLYLNRKNAIDVIIKLYDKGEMEYINITNVIGEQALIKEKESLSEVQVFMANKLIGTPSYDKIDSLIYSLYDDINRRAINHLLKRYNKALLELLGHENIDDKMIELETPYTI